MDYSLYDTADFVGDDAFVAWVKTGENTAYWENVAVHFPEQRGAMLQARAIILASSRLPAYKLKASEQQHIWDNIQENMSDTPPVRKRIQRWYWAAALLTATVAALWWMWKPEDDKGGSVYRQLVQKHTSKNTEEVNSGTKPLVVTLPDGTSVVLQPGARLSYPACFGGSCRREVFLSGVAFFEVSQNTLQPFVVYANEMVINVLGTSFNVRANEKDSLVQVLVKTGKVAIAVQPQHSKIIARLAANEQAVLKRNTGFVDIQLYKPVNTMPQPEIMTYSFVFDNTPVDSVMKTIEGAYGVNIHYDSTLLASCRLTATLTDEPLREKIRLICKALEASCYIEGNNIILTAKGCENVIEN